MTKALVVVDVQESFRRRPLWRTVSTPDLLEKVETLVRHARAEGDFVAWLLHAEPGTGGVFDPARGYVHVMSELTPAADEPVLTKTSYNSFTTTNLGQQLTARGIHELTVCGIRTEQCCETTTRVGCDLGFGVTFAIDATATFPIPHPGAPADLSVDDLMAHPLTLSTQDIMDRTAYVLDGRFAAVRTVKELTGS
jgi:nicotinamidase-related amidase